MDLILALYNDAADVVNQCSEVQAAYVEILNIVTGFQIQSQKPSTSGIFKTEPNHEGSLEVNSSDASQRALLDTQLAIQQVHYAYESANMSHLTSTAVDTALAKPEAAVDMLETIPTVFGRRRSPAVSASLCSLYVAVCNSCPAAEPRTVVIENLADEMDYLLSEGRVGSIPSDLELTTLWMDSLGKSMNPALSNAIIRLSGPIMATMLYRQAAGSSTQNLEDLQKWSAMMADAIHEDRVSGFNSLCSSPTPQTLSPYSSRGVSSVDATLGPKLKMRYATSPSTPASRQVKLSDPSSSSAPSFSTRPTPCTTLQRQRPILPTWLFS